MDGGRVERVIAERGWRCRPSYGCLAEISPGDKDRWYQWVRFQGEGVRTRYFRERYRSQVEVNGKEVYLRKPIFRYSMIAALLGTAQ